MGQDSIKENETVVQLCDGQKSVSTRSMSRTVIAAMANKIIDMILHAPLHCRQRGPHDQEAEACDEENKRKGQAAQSVPHQEIH